VSNVECVWQSSTLVVPVIVSSLNRHSHWSCKEPQREAVAAALGKLDTVTIPLVKRVRLVRLAPKALDYVNLVGALKHVQDQVAAWLAGQNDVRKAGKWGRIGGPSGRGDDSPTCGIDYSFEQEPSKLWGVRLELSRGT
jgi:hypothetical protein